MRKNRERGGEGRLVHASEIWDNCFSVLSAFGICILLLIHLWGCQVALWGGDLGSGVGAAALSHHCLPMLLCPFFLSSAPHSHHSFSSGTP